MSENVTIVEGEVGRRFNSVNRIIVDGVVVGIPDTNIGTVTTERVGGVTYYVASVRATSSPSYGAQCGVSLDGVPYVGNVDESNVLVVRYPNDRSRELRISFSGSTATLRERQSFGFNRIQVFGNSGELIPFVPASERKSGTKYVTKNGTYKASSDNIHSWSKFKVSIPGAKDGDDPVIPAGLEPDKPFEDMDDDEIDEKTEEISEDLDDFDPTNPDGKNNPFKPPVTPTDLTLVGDDPDTGEHVKVNKDGKKPVPNVTMAIEQPPDRIRYNEGEKIDFKGLLCELSENGYVFTDDKHPDGHALSGELSYPQMVARFKGGETTPDEAAEMIEWTADPAYILDDPTKWIARVNDRDFFKKTSGKAIVAFVQNYGPSGGWAVPWLLSPVMADAAKVVINKNSGEETYVPTIAPDEVTYGGVTWYFNHNYAYSHPGFTNYADDIIAYDAEGNDNLPGIAAAILKAARVRVTGTPKATVPVHWKSPYDGTLHIDSFEIKLGSGDEDTDFADISIAPPLERGGGGGLSFDVDEGLPDDYYFNPTASGDLTGSNNWWGYSGKAAKEHLGG